MKNDLDIHSLASRVELAHRSHGSAVELVQKLATQLDTAFARLEIARESLDKEGVDAAMRMPEWLQQAYTHWRTARMADEREREQAARMAAARLPMEHVPSVYQIDSRD